MKQIKTIMKASEDWELFDEAVNAAIAAGWTLVKRDVLKPYEARTRLYVRTLYAELERETVEEKQSEPKERICRNCAHHGTPVYDYPCTVCHDCDEWEPET